MVNGKDNQKNPEEEGQPEFSKKDPTFTEREVVNGAGENYDTEPRDEGRPEDADLGELPVLENSPQKPAYQSAADMTQMSAVSPEVAASFAEAEARRAEAELRTRELEMQANQAEWEAARQARLQDAQVQLEMESRKQEAEARKAETAQIREKNKQAFELQMNKWSIDKM